MAEEKDGLGCSWIILLLPLEIVKSIWWLNNTPSSSFWHKYAYWSLIVVGAIVGIAVVGWIIYRLFFRDKK